MHIQTRPAFALTLAVLAAAGPPPGAGHGLGVQREGPRADPRRPEDPGRHRHRAHLQAPAPPADHARRQAAAVACGESAQADFIDLATRKSVRKVGLGDDPEIFDISADGKTLYVTNEEDAELGIVDLASGKRTGAGQGRRRTRGRQALAPTASWSTSPARSANLVQAVDLASGKVVHRTSRPASARAALPSRPTAPAVGQQRARRQRERDRHQDAPGGRDHPLRGEGRRARPTSRRWASP
jgi:hypothetical protein